MGKNVLIFLLSFIIAFGGGYAFYHSKQQPKEVASESTTAQAPAPAPTPADSGKAEAPAPAKTTDSATAAAPEGEIFTKRGCVSCHSVSALNIHAGQVGPDLSQAYVEAEGKHGMKLEEFLKKPNSAVMSGVLSSKPLTDEERKAVLDALKIASEKK
ncbi:cytochrome C [Brevibacillus ginsengisoli]|uniref:cytochrome C n=1 Tax=Brevibacillus ginsengisoli TaxID=363854 RepID=UPI003CF8AEAB